MKPSKKTRVFIGSSSEGSRLLGSLEKRLRHYCDTVPWNKGLFAISETHIESLEKALADVEFAVLIATADDLRKKRGVKSKVPRDNVVFELGLFMGRLTRRRTFIVCDSRARAKLPTDLLGINVAQIDSRGKELDAAVDSAVKEIVQAIRRPRPDGAAVARSPSGMISPSAILSDWEALYGAVVSWPAVEGHEITIQSADTTWAWDLVPTLIHWRTNGVGVRVSVPPRNEQTPGEENARRTLLVGLGIDVREAANLAVSGFFLKTKYPQDDAAITLLNRGPEAPIATMYEGGSHSCAIAALHRMLFRPDEGAAPREPFVPSLVAQDPDEVLKLLKKGVSQYSPPTVELQVAALPTKKLLLLSDFTRAYKHRQIDRLYDVYKINKHKAFTSLAVQLRSGHSILTPPVVEVRDEGLVVIEGETRAAYCLENGIKDYLCIAVSGVKENLPGTPVAIDEVTESERSVPDKRPPDFLKLFRYIERATHPY